MPEIPANPETLVIEGALVEATGTVGVELEAASGANRSFVHGVRYGMVDSPVSPLGTGKSATRTVKRTCTWPVE